MLLIWRVHKRNRPFCVYELCRVVTSFDESQCRAAALPQCRGIREMVIAYKELLKVHVFFGKIFDSAAMRQCGSAALTPLGCLHSVKVRHIYIYFKLLYIIIYNNYYNIIVQLAADSDLRNAALPHCRTLDWDDFNIWNKSKIKKKKACNPSEFFVPLQCQSMRTAGEPLRVKIARFKSRNCAH